MAWWDRSMERELECLEGEGNAHARGARFELLVQRLFERAHFSVERNAGVARPRQTDLFASYGDDSYLIETKWKKAPADIDDIHSLRSRLELVPRPVTGLFFSMSGYTKTAVQDVTGRRDPAILLFTSEETSSLCARRLSLLSLLRRKRESLTRDGRVLLDGDYRPWSGRRKPNRAALPPADVAIVDLEGRELPWVAGAGEFGNFVFAEELPDVDWTPAQGVGVGFDPDPPIRDRRDLGHVLEVLRGVGWVSSAGRWSIQQMHTNWHGAGAGSFLDALDRWEERYEQAAEETHHSEEVTYFDICDGGFYTLSMNVGANRKGLVTYPHLSAQLMGIPIHPEPFRQIVRAFDRDDQAYFRPLSPDPVQTLFHSPGERLRLEPVALLSREDDGERWITGIVARHPFRGGGPAMATDTAARRLDNLTRSELLVCELRSWHEPGREIEYYYLWSLEMAQTYRSTVIDAVAEWADPREDERSATLTATVVRLVKSEEVGAPNDD